MKKVIVFEEAEFEALRKAVIESIIEHSREGWGVKFISRDRDAGGQELEDMAMRGHLIFCMNRVWPS